MDRWTGVCEHAGYRQDARTLEHQSLCVMIAGRGHHARSAQFVLRGNHDLFRGDCRAQIWLIGVPPGGAVSAGEGSAEAGPGGALVTWGYVKAAMWRAAHWA